MEGIDDMAMVTVEAGVELVVHGFLQKDTVVIMTVLLVAMGMMNILMVVGDMMTVSKVVVVLVGEMTGIILVMMMIDMGEGRTVAVQVTDEVGAGATAL